MTFVGIMLIISAANKLIQAVTVDRYENESEGWKTGFFIGSLIFCGLYIYAATIVL